MRSNSRQKQRVWFSTITKDSSSIDPMITYSKPIMKRFTVSATAGLPKEIAAGIVPTYDRYITRYKNSCCENDIEYEEGMAVWVDKIPKIDDSGNLVMEEDGITPVTPPDYTLKKIIDTAKGSVARYGIKKVGGSE